MKVNEIMKRIEFGLVALLIAVLPVTVITSFANVIETPKIFLTVSILLVVLLLKALRALITNSISFSASRFDIPVFLLAAVYIASAVLESPNKMEAFFLPGSATVIIAGSLLYFVVNQFKRKDKAVLTKVFFFSAVFYSFIVLITVAGVFSAIPQLPAFMKSNTFSTIGGSLPGVVFLLIAAPFGVVNFIREKAIPKRALLGISTAILAFAFVVNVFNILPGRPTAPQLPSYDTSWKITVDALKNNPLLGMGPGNYLSAFSRFLPIEYNQTDIWAARFTSGRSFLFTMATEVGIAGLAAVSIIGLAVLKLIQERRIEDTATVALGISTTMLIVFPATSLLLLVFFILLALVSDSKASAFEIFNLEGKADSKLPVLVATAPLLIGIFIIGFYTTKVATADFQYKQSLVYISENNGGKAYETLQQAITTNPYIDRYRVSYAQINLALANTLASNEDITDQDRQTITQLIQQSIREGKNAVALNPTKSSNWDVLGGIYMQIAPLAEGSYDFAAQTYAQAIALDPINPNLRISLGGVYYSVGQYENAIDTFTLAARVKNDHANVFFNLAVAYRENNEIDQAMVAMSRVLALVDRDSNDFEVAKKALEELQERKANADIPSSDTLTTPEDSADTAIDQEIELSEDEAPPEAPVLDDAEETDATDDAEVVLGEEDEVDAEESPDPTEEPSPTPENEP